MISEKLALVTGSSRGIGRGIALELAREGANVVVNYKNQKEKAVEVARSIEALGRRSLVVKADVSNQKEVLAMRDIVMSEFKEGVDILVNNAGIHHHLKSWEIDEDEWRRIMAVNVDGVFRCTKAFTHEMRIRKWGRVINISSIDAFTGTNHEAHYGTSKAALLGLTRSLALELAPYNITVNTIAPGWFDTDMTSGTVGEERKKALEKIPMGRMGRPQEVGFVAAFLASEKASFITGQTIHINGGEAMF
ncbi:MAG: 3-oxoacyl-ACP reductase family protein [Candidatus Bathyarchaeia archaeon]